MKTHGQTNGNIHFLNHDDFYEDSVEFAPMLDDDAVSEGAQRSDMPEEAVPEHLECKKTILIPLVQTMEDYIQLHYRRGIAAELCRQIVECEVATGYDIDDIQVVPQAETCRFRKMAFWRASTSVVIADIDVGIDLLLKDGIIDDTVKASFRVALHIDMEESEVLECNIYSESDALPERDMWLLSNYLVPILRKDEIEAGSEELHGKYYPEALCDLKVHNALNDIDWDDKQIIELANARVMEAAQKYAVDITIPLRRSRSGHGLSGYKGVHPDPKDPSWLTKISFNGKMIGGGKYRTPGEAAVAYDYAMDILRGEKAWKNRDHRDQLPNLTDEIRKYVLSRLEQSFSSLAGWRDMGTLQAAKQKLAIAQAEYEQEKAPEMMGAFFNPRQPCASCQVNRVTELENAIAV